MEGGGQDWQEQDGQAFLLTTGAGDRVGFVRCGPASWAEAKITGNGMPHQPKAGAVPITADELPEALRGPLGAG